MKKTMSECIIEILNKKPGQTPAEVYKQLKTYTEFSKIEDTEAKTKIKVMLDEGELVQERERIKCSVGSGWAFPVFVKTAENNYLFLARLKRAEEQKAMISVGNWLSDERITKLRKDKILMDMSIQLMLGNSISYIRLLQKIHELTKITEKQLLEEIRAKVLKEIESEKGGE